jgi:hypothetical protein
MTKAERHYTTLFRKQRPDRGILECFWDAKRHIHFRATLSADVKAHAKRSKAAKKAWKTRRANAR